MTVYVLDYEGYDVRGGNAEVYATLETAQAGIDEPWQEVRDGVWATVDDHDGFTSGHPHVYRQVVQG